MPCRAGEAVTRCLHGLAPSDPFDVRVPWSWSEHPGVVHEGEYRVKSYEDLLAAWQAQAARERAEKEQAEDEAAGSAVPNEGSQSQTTPLPKSHRPAVSPTLSTVHADETKPSPIAKQRAQIADFMKRHEQLAANHPFATPAAAAGTGWRAARRRMNPCPTAPGPAGCAA
jgi:hypothetical protein